MRAAWIRGYRIAFALLALIAVAYQFYDSSIDGDFSAVSFFSFFTIQSNLFAIAIFLYLAFGLDDEAARSPRLDLIRGAATLYLTVTFVVYGLLLSGYQEELQTTTPWVDTVLHRIFPIVVYIDWIVDPPRGRVAYRRALIWLVYPAAYCVYSLVRGPIVDWYPYPFLDPRSPGGYGVVALYCVGIAVAAVAFTWLVVAIGNRVRLAIDS